MMPVTINVEEYLPLQKADLKKKINNILDANMENLFNEYVVQEIRIISAAMNMPKEFIDGVKFIKTGNNKGEIINTWGSSEKPLALWFNHGTVTHWIEPIDPDGVLAWGNTFGKNSPAIYFQGTGSKKGDMMFSRGHYVSGINPTYAMETGYEIGSKHLAVAASELIQKELESGEY